MDSFLYLAGYSPYDLLFPWPHEQCPAGITESHRKMTKTISEAVFTALPKAELHVHLEGSIAPSTLVELAARHGVTLTPEETAPRYAPGTFDQFIENFIWITSFLRGPEDYALIARPICRECLAATERSLRGGHGFSIGVMFRLQLRIPTPISPRCAIARSRRFPKREAEVYARCRPSGGAPRQRWKSRGSPPSYASPDIVAYGIGGDELGAPHHRLCVPCMNSRQARGMHRLDPLREKSAGPEIVREAIELLGVERIDHGIAVMRDERTMDLVAARNIPLDLCLTSNLPHRRPRLRQIGRPTAGYDQHPLPSFFGAACL